MEDTKSYCKLGFIIQSRQNIFSIANKDFNREYIDNYSGHLNIFTDGSKQSNNSIASAVYIPYFDVQISKKIPDLCSIYS